MAFTRARILLEASTAPDCFETREAEHLVASSVKALRVARQVTGTADLGGAAHDSSPSLQSLPNASSPAFASSGRSCTRFMPATRRAHFLAKKYRSRNESRHAKDVGKGFRDENARHAERNGLHRCPLSDDRPNDNGPGTPARQLEYLSYNLVRRVTRSSRHPFHSQTER